MFLCVWSGDCEQRHGAVGAGHGAAGAGAAPRLPPSPKQYGKRGGEGALTSVHAVFSSSSNKNELPLQVFL